MEQATITNIYYQSRMDDGEDLSRTTIIHSHNSRKNLINSTIPKINNTMTTIQYNRMSSFLERLQIDDGMHSYSVAEVDKVKLDVRKIVESRCNTM